MSRIIAIIGISLLLLLGSSCATKSSRAIRKAERMERKQAAKERKEYERAKTAHFKHQAPKTKKMIREDKRRANRLNRKLKRR